MRRSWCHGKITGSSRSKIQKSEKIIEECYCQGKDELVTALILGLFAYAQIYKDRS